MGWKKEYNDWKEKQDWSKYKSRNDIDDTICKKLSTMLDAQQAKVDRYEKALNEINEDFKRGAVSISKTGRKIMEALQDKEQKEEDKG